MPRRPKPEPLPRCTATLWNSGDQCEYDASPGAIHCPAHLSLLPPADWSAAGSTAKLPDTLQPLARSTGFTGLTEELALARLHLLSAVEQRGCSADILAGINTVARLLRLQREIEKDVLDCHADYERRRRNRERSSSW